MKPFRFFAGASDDLEGGPEGASPRQDSVDAATAARWAQRLDESAQDQARDDLARARSQLAQARAELAPARAELAQARAELAQARAELAQARAELTDLRRDHDAARVEATAWRRRHAEAVQDCADITARREALIESMASGMAAMMLAMSTKTWDEGWESAANDALVKLQNPYRLAATDAARPSVRWS